MRSKLIRWCVFEVDLGLEVLLLGSLGDCRQVWVLQLLSISKALLTTCLIQNEDQSEWWESPTWSQRPFNFISEEPRRCFCHLLTATELAPGTVVNIGRDHKRRWCINSRTILTDPYPGHYQPYFTDEKWMFREIQKSPNHTSKKWADWDLDTDLTTYITYAF